MLKTYNLAALLVAVILFATNVNSQVVDGTLSVAFVYSGPVGDVGWSFTHDQGRVYVEKKYNNLETAIKPDVADDVSAPVFRDYAQRGFGMIVGTSLGYGDAMLNVSKEFPNNLFVLMGEVPNGNNLAAATVKLYQTRYLGGYLAGLMTKTNKIGYVSAFAFPSFNHIASAFAIGVKRANPNATVYYMYTNSWYGPTAEKRAVKVLVEQYGVDFVTQHLDSYNVQQAALEYNIHSFGYASDMFKFVGPSVVSGDIFEWGVVYAHYIDQIFNGTWNATEQPLLDWGVEEGLLRLANYSSEVNPTIRAAVESERLKIASGNDTIFCGSEIAGFTKKGDCFTRDEMRSMPRMVDFAVILGPVPDEPTVNTVVTQDIDSDSAASSMKVSAIISAMLIMMSYVM